MFADSAPCCASDALVCGLTPAAFTGALVAMKRNYFRPIMYEGYKGGRQAGFRIIFVGLKAARNPGGIPSSGLVCQSGHLFHSLSLQPGFLCSVGFEV